MRPQLTAEQVAENAKTYLDQVRPILDFDTPGRLEIRYNSEWLSKLDLAEDCGTGWGRWRAAELAKEGFDNRMQQEKPFLCMGFCIR